MALDSQLCTEPNPYNPADTWRDTAQSVSYNMTGQGQGPFLEPSGDGAVIRAYTDLKRHNLCDPVDHPDSVRHFCNEQLAQTRPEQDGKPGTEFFLTRKLWDVGNSAPYGHRGDLPTITEAIWAHGGEGRPSYEAFHALPSNEQAAVITFLKTLQVLPPGSPRVIYDDHLPQNNTAGTGGAAPLSGSVLESSSSAGDNQTFFVALATVLGIAAVVVVLLVQRRRVF
jgi:hypothetical protein